MKRIGIAAAVATAPGCSFDGDDDDRPERPGELGAGTFRYICVGDADPYCASGFVADTFPERFAVNGAFDLDFDPHEYYPSPDEPLPRVIAGSPDSVRSEAMAFYFVRPGYAGFLARNAVGEVIDLRHLYGSAVERIAVVTGGSQELSRLELDVGQDIDVTVEPQDALRSVLAGSLTWGYTIDDTSVAEVLTTDRDRDVTVRAVAPGETTLRIDAGGFMQEVAVVVAGEVDATDGAQTDGGETGAAETGVAETGAAEEDGGSSGAGESGSGMTTGGN
jgi:hypothetical protein